MRKRRSQKQRKKLRKKPKEKHQVILNHLLLKVILVARFFQSQFPRPVPMAKMMVTRAKSNINCLQLFTIATDQTESEERRKEKLMFKTFHQLINH